MTHPLLPPTPRAALLGLALLWCLPTAGCDDTQATPEPAADAAADALPPADAAPPIPDAQPADAGPATGLVLNEIDCRDTDAVELFNPGAPGLAQGWVLADSAGHSQPLDALGVLPAGPTSLAPDFPVYCGVTTVRLLDATGAEADQVRPGLGAATDTWGRLPDATGAWGFCAPTPGAPNQPPIQAGADWFAGDRVHTIELTWSDEVQRVLARDPGRVQPATFAIDGGPAEPVGVHVVGPDGRYRRVDLKPSVEVRFDHLDPTGRREGLAALQLDNSMLDASLLRAWLGGEVLRQAGVPAPRVGFAQVSLNGTPFGLYLLLEPVDGPYAAARFPDTWALYAADRRDLFPNNVSRFELVAGEASTRPLLTWLADTAQTPPPEGFYAATGDYLMWRRWWQAFAGETWVRNAEGYSTAQRRVHLHMDPADRVDFLPGALDGSFKGPDILYPRTGRAAALCFDDGLCRLGYQDALIAFSRRIDADALVAGLQARAALIRDAVAADDRRIWGLAQFDAEVAALADAVRARADALQSLRACVDAGTDADEDGWPCGFDCDDADPDTRPDAPEICGDGKDQSCTGVADDGACPRCQPVDRDGHRYWRCTDARTYAQAETSCARLDAQLVRIDSLAENDWLYRQARAVGGDSWWIGLTDRATEGEFVWADGEAPTFTRWGGNEPNDYGTGEDCGHYRSDGQWNDQSCETRYPYLCEAPCVPEDLDNDGAPSCGADCADDDPFRHPGAEEICDDGIDNDCDGRVDEGCTECFERERAGHRYWICPAAKAYEAAEAQCAALGAQLAVIDDADENQWLFDEASAVQPQRWWLGLTDREAEWRWRWADGSALQFAAWTRGEPNDGGQNEDCAHFWADQAAWNDIACTAEHGVLCEAPAE